MIALLITVVYNQVFVFKSYLAADSGSLAININFYIIPSIGSTSSVFISLENNCINTISIKQTKSVLQIEKTAIIVLYEL